MNTAKDSFTLSEEIQGVTANDYFLVSYDVCSLFTSIPLTEIKEIAVELIFQNKPNLKMNLNNFLNVQPLVLIFYLKVIFKTNGFRPCKFIHGLLSKKLASGI